MPVGFKLLWNSRQGLDLHFDAIQYEVSMEGEIAYPGASELQTSFDSYQFLIGPLLTHVGDSMWGTDGGSVSVVCCQSASSFTCEFRAEP